MEELDFCEKKIEDILNGKRQNQHSSALYQQLKVEREAAKQLLVERFSRPGATVSDKKCDLRRYMGRLGALSAKVGTAKVTSDYSKTSLEDEFGDNNPETDQQQGQCGGQGDDRGQGQGRGRGRDRGRGRGRGRGCERGRSRERGRGRERGTVYTRPAPDQVPRVSSTARLDSVTEHINRHNLNLTRLGTVRSNGDCFYDSIWNLVIHYDIETEARDVVDLRRLIAASVRTHPNISYWKEVHFKNNGYLLRSFITKHSKPGTYTDSDGLIIHAAAEFLNSTIHVVGSSNTPEAEVTKIPASNPLHTLHLGYHQDQSDRGGRDGHFESFIPRQILPVVSNLHKITAEKKILDLLYTEPDITSGSLGRLKSIDMDIGSIQSSNILATLNCLHAHYGRESDNGALVRRIIRKVNNVIASSTPAWNTSCNILDISEIPVFMEELPNHSLHISNISSLDVANITQVWTL